MEENKKVNLEEVETKKNLQENDCMLSEEELETVNGGSDVFTYIGKALM